MAESAEIGGAMADKALLQALASQAEQSLADTGGVEKTTTEEEEEEEEEEEGGGGGGGGGDEVASQLTDEAGDEGDNEADNERDDEDSAQRDHEEELNAKDYEAAEVAHLAAEEADEDSYGALSDAEEKILGVAGIETADDELGDEWREWYDDDHIYHRAKRGTAEYDNAPAQELEIDDLDNDEYVKTVRQNGDARMQNLIARLELDYAHQAGLAEKEVDDVHDFTAAEEGALYLIRTTGKNEVEGTLEQTDKYGYEFKHEDGRVYTIIGVDDDKNPLHRLKEVKKKKGLDLKPLIKGNLVRQEPVTHKGVTKKQSELAPTESSSKGSNKLNKSTHASKPTYQSASIPPEQRVECTDCTGRKRCSWKRSDGDPSKACELCQMKGLEHTCSTVEVVSEVPNINGQDETNSLLTPDAPRPIQCSYCRDIGMQCVLMEGDNRPCQSCEEDGVECTFDDVRVDKGKAKISKPQEEAAVAGAEKHIDAQKSKWTKARDASAKEQLPTSSLLPPSVTSTTQSVRNSTANSNTNPVLDSISVGKGATTDKPGVSRKEHQKDASGAAKRGKLEAEKKTKLAKKGKAAPMAKEASGATSKANVKTKTPQAAPEPDDGNKVSKRKPAAGVDVGGGPQKKKTQTETASGVQPNGGRMTRAQAKLAANKAAGEEQ